MVELERFHQGDHRHFSKLVETYGWLVEEVVWAFRQDPDESQDFLQEVWVRVYKKRRSFSGSGSFEGWLHRVATNVCINLCTEKKRRTRVRHWLVIWRPDESRVWTPPSPSHEIEEKERRQQFHLAFTHLSDRERQAITLRLIEDKDAREVAELMGIKPSTVRSLIRHGVTRLKRVMGEN